MKLSRVITAAFAASLFIVVASAPAGATETSTASAPATVSPAAAGASRAPSLAQASAFVIPVAADLPAALTPSALAVGSEAGLAPDLTPRLESVVYRPRYRERRYNDRGPRLTSLSQLHAGFFDPDGGGRSAFVLGFRGGPQLDENVQIGLGADWQHKAENRTEIVGEQNVGGQVTTRRRELSRSSFNLFPAMAFIQLSASPDMPVIPYFGLGGGYEVLFLSADDFQTGENFDATYSGWGWEAWGGAAYPMSGRARLTGEIFVNKSEVDREVTDSITGETFRELVDMDGVGARFGVTWGF